VAARRAGLAWMPFQQQYVVHSFHQQAQLRRPSCLKYYWVNLEKSGSEKGWLSLAAVLAAACRPQRPPAGAAALSKLSEILLDGFRQEWPPGGPADVPAAACHPQRPPAGAAASSKLSEILLGKFRQEWPPVGPAAVPAAACRPQRPPTGAAASSKLSETLLDGFRQE
jgi:hypothetical protein